MLLRLLGAKAAAIAVTTTLAATGAAAATGSLPAPAQVVVSDIVGVVGIDVPLPEAHKAEREAQKAAQKIEQEGLKAEQETELLHFGLPDLRGLEKPVYTAEAAE